MLSLSNRSILQISGKDAIKLLQGITTNNINTLINEDQLHYTAFLTAKVSNYKKINIHFKG